MDKKVHIIRMWTDHVQERFTGILDAAKKNHQKFKDRLKNFFGRSSEKTHKKKES